MIQNPDCLQFHGTPMRALLSAALKLSWGQGRLAQQHFSVFHCSHSKYSEFSLDVSIFSIKSLIFLKENFPPSTVLQGGSCFKNVVGENLYNHMLLTAATMENPFSLKDYSLQSPSVLVVQVIFFF